jgi:hypothetical protein
MTIAIGVNPSRCSRQPSRLARSGISERDIDPRVALLENKKSRDHGRTR